MTSNINDTSKENEVLDLAPGWVTETVVIWTQFPARKGILDLSKRNLAKMPDELYRMRKLESLIFTNNCLTELPSELSKLADAGLLKKIDCSSNQIHTVSDEIAEIKSLESIILASNQLSYMPPVIYKLFQLSTLDFSNNHIESIDDSISNLVFLENLYLQNNNLTSLPSCISSVGSLKELDISHNNIANFPNGIHKLKRLKKLKVNNNQIEELPDELGFLLSLDELSIESNPFSKQPEIEENNLYEIGKLFKFLRNRIRQRKDLRMLLFTERDNSRNTRFETMEGDSKPTLTGATLEKLALFLTQVALPDVDTLNCVEICYSYFTTPEELLDLFFLRYDLNKNSTQSNSKESKKVGQVIQSRIIFVIIMLLRKFNVDNVIYGDDILRRLKEIMVNEGGVNERQMMSIVTSNESVNLNILGADEATVQKERKKRQEKETRDKQKLDDDLRKKYSKEKKRFHKQQKKHDRTTERIGLGLSHSSEDKHLLSFTAYDLAMEISLIDSEFFSVIPKNEFLKQKWAKKNPEINAPYITNCIENFNNLSNWIITWIVKQTEIKIRIRTIHHILDVAGELLELGDYSALFAIGSAFSCAAVTRLKETFLLLDDKRNVILDTLNKLTDNTGNYKFYKQLLAESLEKKYAIPHLAIYLKNLTFTEEGNPNYIDDSDVINIGKFRFITNMIDEIEKIQPKGYQYILTENKDIRKLILNEKHRIDNSEEQYNWSLKCEASKRKAPPVTTEPVTPPPTKNFPKPPQFLLNVSKPIPTSRSMTFESGKPTKYYPPMEKQASSTRLPVVRKLASSLGAETEGEEDDASEENNDDITNNSKQEERITEEDDNKIDDDEENRDDVCNEEMDDFDLSYLG